MVDNDENIMSVICVWFEKKLVNFKSTDTDTVIGHVIYGHEVLCIETKRLQSLFLPIMKKN